MTDVEFAVSLFENGFTCSQAILSVYGEKYGLNNEMAYRIADGFGGGMGRMGHICGSLTGAYMVLSLKHGGTSEDDEEARDNTMDAISEFTKRFKAKKETIMCKELIGHELDTQEKRKAAKESGVFNEICPKLVQAAAEILEELL